MYTYKQAQLIAVRDVGIFGIPLPPSEKFGKYPPSKFCGNFTNTEKNKEN